MILKHIGLYDRKPQINQINKDSVYYFEEINKDIILCFVNINLFIKFYFSNVPFDNYRILPNVNFIENVLKEKIFCDKEMEYLNHFKTLKKQYEWMAGRLAVKYLVLEKSNSNTALDDVMISYLDNGAPYLEDFPEYEISISHSHEYAVAGITTNRDIKFGIDIEKIEQKNMTPILDIAFSDKEKFELTTLSNEIIFKNWTIKEAFLKYIKQGFSEKLKHVEILNDNIFWNHQPVSYLEVISKIIHEEYAFTILFNK